MKTHSSIGGRVAPFLAALFAFTVIASFAGIATAQVEHTKDKAKLRQMLRQKMHELHREVLEEGGVKHFVDLDDRIIGPDGKPIDEEEAPQEAVPADGAVIIQAKAPEPPIGQGPRIVFDVVSHDFGINRDGESLVCKFPFRNRGTEKLIIHAVNTGCGCTAAKLPKQEFEPGEGAEIEITYNPKGSGKQQRSIQVATNDALSPNTALIISAQIIPVVEARPATIQFGTVPIGETRSMQMVIVSRDKDLKITGIDVNGPEVVAALAPDARPEMLIEPELPGVAVINVSLKEDAPVGRVLRMITVKAMASKEDGSAPEPHEMRVNVFAAVKGELTVNPQLIRVPPIAAGATFEREAIITRSGNKPFSITKAEVSNSTLPGVTVTTEPYQEGDIRGYKVRIAGNAGQVANNFRGSVVLTTDVEREKTVEIQFSGIVRVPPPSGGAEPPAGTRENPIPVEVTPTGSAPRPR